MSTSPLMAITNFFGIHVNAANVGVDFKNLDGSYKVSGTALTELPDEVHTDKVHGMYQTMTIDQSLQFNSYEQVTKEPKWSSAA